MLAQGGTLIDHPFRAETRLAQRGFFADPPFSAKAYSGIARRAGRSPSAARKLPKQRPRSPRQSAVVGKPWGVNEGSAEGASSGGAAPFTGPFCPRRRRPKLKQSKAPNPPQLASRASLFYTEKILAAKTAAPNHIFCPARGA